jgi:hypothetical protein
MSRAVRITRGAELVRAEKYSILPILLHLSSITEAVSTM